ncbi:hypothetical protein OC834_003308 [Tilletia horrida]|nr:hypothetical protein OC834_003308 [Tilletia horrida]
MASSAASSSSSSLPQKRTVESILEHLRSGPFSSPTTSPTRAIASQSQSHSQSKKKARKAKVPDYLTTSSQAAGLSSAPLKKRVLSTSTRLYVKRVKIDREKAEEIRKLAASLGAVTTDLEHANVIVTDSWSQPRAKAGLRPQLYQEQAHVVHSSWLEDTAEQGIYLGIDKYRVLPAPTSSDAFADSSKFARGDGDTSIELATTDEEKTDSATDGESDLSHSLQTSPEMRLPLRGLWFHILPAKLDKAGVETIKARLLALGADIVPQENADAIISQAATAARVKPFLKEKEQPKVPLLQARWLDEVETRQAWVDPGDRYVVGFPEQIKLTWDKIKQLSEQNRTPPSGSLVAQRVLTAAAPDPATVETGSGAAAAEALGPPDADEDEEEPPALWSREGSEAGSPERSVAEEQADEGGESLDDYAYKNSFFACERPSPLRCINQELVDQLLILQKQRELVGEKRSALSYERALSSIKAYREDLSKIPVAAASIRNVGPKISSLIKQFYQQGNIAEVQQIRSDSALRVMMDFMELYGIGPTTARELYNQGCRNVEDVIQVGRSYGTKLDVRECMKILPNLRQKIPRAEVESIATTVMNKANELLPGCLHTVCGGFRRGKPASGDVDIVISHASHDPGTVCRKLIEALKSEKLVTHVIGLSNMTDSDDHSHTRHNVAELVFKAKATKTNPAPIHRRLDLIFCRREVYGACIVGWTGSTMFERDIRRWAQKKLNWKFHNYGITDRETGELIETPQEIDVFRELGLDWIPPQFRNCDA